MATFRWPGSTGKHTISWEQHQANVAGKALAAPGSPAAESPDVYAGSTVPAPLDAGYLAEVEGLGKTRDTTVTGLGEQRKRGIIDYGFTVTPGVADPVTGVVGPTQAGAFDPNNPFSKASLLKKNYDISRASTGNQMAAGGGLYSGAYQTSQDSINRGQLGAEDTLNKSLNEFLMQNAGAQTQAGTDYDIGVGQALGAATGRALDNPLYTPITDTPAAPIAPVGPVAPKPPVVKPAGGVGKATTKKSTGRPANQASGVGSTRRPRVVTHTRSVHTP